MMLRLLLILLLVANGAYALWHFVLREAPSQALTPVAQGPSLRLLSEEVVSEPVIELACLEVGVFASSEDSARFMQGAAALGYEAILAQRQVPGSLQYWVLLPPEHWQPQAEAILQRLAEAAVESFHIQDGDYAGHLSLGIFSTAQGAQSQQARIGALGLEAELREVQRQSVLDLVRLIDHAGEISALALRDYLQGWPELDVQEKLCETIAPQD